MRSFREARAGKQKVKWYTGLALSTFTLKPANKYLNHRNARRIKVPSREGSTELFVPFFSFQKKCSTPQIVRQP
jgi:hypothetical protein